MNFSTKYNLKITRLQFQQNKIIRMTILPNQWFTKALLEETNSIKVI